VLCRELTKTYEEIVRLPLGSLVGWAREREVRGEITLVVGGAPAPAPPAASDLAEMVKAREAAGLDRKAALSDVARSAGVPRREVYDAVLAARAASSTEAVDYA
jgi:16S rRNA (cytidine1402-2'-O)-methyltransferase